jgi:hypothetical protein
VAYTLAQFETALQGRLTEVLDAARIPHAAVSPVPRFGGPIGWALSAGFGFAPADPNAPTDTDVALVPPPLFWKLVDIAELQLIETVVRIFSLQYKTVTQPDVTRERDVAALTRYLEDRRKAVARIWGVGVPQVQGAVVVIEDRAYLNEF